jgi:hypothetical protein
MIHILTAVWILPKIVIGVPDRERPDGVMLYDMASLLMKRLLQ